MAFPARVKSLWTRLVLRRRRQIIAEQQWEELVRRSERLARTPTPPPPIVDADTAPIDDGFDELVGEALDRLPREFQRVLETVPVVISDRGAEQNAYGWYEGDTIVRDNYGDRIVIFRDTLVRDFGHDRELLSQQVERTVRHEVAHHLGWDERGVRELGL